MKNIFTLLNAACLALLLNNHLAAQTTPLSANGRLRIINRQLCNESGTAVQLRGMSSHGLHWFPQCYTAGSLQALAGDWGADVFRAAMYVDEGGYTSDPAGLRAKVTQLVNWAEQYGMYCIIDWHILNPGDPTVHTAEAKDFFATMAQQFAGKKNVLYEICNEPNGVNWSTIKSYAEQVIPVIRQRDANGLILVGTPSYSGTPWDVLGNPLTGSNAYNVMYTYHFYAGSHYLSSVRSNLENVLAQLPLFVSEWGTSNYSGNGGDDYNSAQIWMDFLAGGNSSGIKVSWANWNFADKNETSSALSPGACSSGSWNSTSTSGAWVKSHILNPADNFGPPAPSVVITSPANGATVATGSTVAINATVNNAAATKVEFYDGTSRLGEDATAPYSWTVAAITGGSHSFTAKAIVSSGSLTSAAVSVTASAPANQPPAVSLTAPANNAAFTAPATITLTATASDADGIARVEFYNGTTKLGEDATSPYSYTWTNVAAGAYSLTAKAVDNAGTPGTSAAVAVQVYTQGSSGGDVAGPDCVLANDVKVYEVSAANLVNATNFNWWCTGSTQSITPVAGQPGKVTINFGPGFTGGQVCVGINYSADPWYKQFCKNVTLCTTQPPPPSNQPPTVNLTSPAANAAFTAPANITITASASDADGIMRVEFYNGNNKIGEDATAPYSVTWQNVGAGTYTLTAKAIDNLNAAGTSGSVTVVVNGAAPPPAASGISGPDCVMANDVKTYQLGADDRVNATAYSWWVNGSTQSITPGSNGSVSINFGPYFTGGQVWVGVNYSASPWYKQFSKNVTPCSGARTTTAAALGEARDDKGFNEPAAVQRRLFPTVSNGNFTFVPDKELRSLTVVDATGRQCFRSGSRASGQSVIFGDGFTAGTYFVQVFYADNTRRTIKLVKTK